MKSIKYIILAFILLYHTPALFGQEDVEQLFKNKDYDKVITMLLEKDQRNTLTLRDFYLIAKSYSKTQQYSNGFIYANRMIIESEKIKDTVNLLIGANLKVENLIDLDKIDLGLKFSKDVLPVFRKQDSVSFQSFCFKLGMLYYHDGQYQKAYETYNKITLKKFKNTKIFATNYALALEGINKYDEALEYSNKVIRMTNDTKNETVLALANIANVLLKKGQLKKAKMYLDSASNALTDNSQLYHKKHVFKQYYDLYNALGNTNLAFEYLERIKEVNEDMFNKKREEEINALLVSYKRENETNKNLEKSRKEKLWGTIVLLFIILTLLSILFLFKYRNIKNAHKNVLTEQQLLRSQMTPHFIFNSLSVLQGMILNKEDKKAVRYLSKFSKLLRLILENSREKLVPLDEELKAIQNYVDLHNMRSETPFKFTLNLDENLTDLDVLIPPMLIQPFVENAIEHGFKKNFENAKISIEITFKNNVLVCVIKDNGIGFNASKPNLNTTKKSLSTKITAERLKIFSKEYKVTSGVLIQDRSIFNEKGTQIELTLPYKMEHYA